MLTKIKYASKTKNIRKQIKAWYKNKKKYYVDNKDKILERQKRYREVNRDKVNAQKLKYYEANKDKINAKRREKRKQQRADTSE